MAQIDKLIEAKEIAEKTLEEDIASLTARDRLTFYLNLMEYFVPKRQRSSIEASDNDLPKDIY